MLRSKTANDFLRYGRDIFFRRNKNENTKNKLRLHDRLRYSHLYKVSIEWKWWGSVSVTFRSCYIQSRIFFDPEEEKKSGLPGTMAFLSLLSIIILSNCVWCLLSNACLRIFGRCSMFDDTQVKSKIIKSSLTRTNVRCSGYGKVPTAMSRREE